MLSGRRLLFESESEEGLEILRDILTELSPEEFVGGVVRGLICVDEPSEDVAQIVAEEGAKRVNDLLAGRQHLLAAKTAVVCTPAIFLRACHEGLDAHEDGADPVRIAIIELFGEEPELVNELRQRLESE